MTRSPWLDRARTGALALVVFALAHNVTFLVTYGDTSIQALTRTGHGGQWTATVTLVAILAVALVLAGAVRLAQLTRLAHDLDLDAIGTEGAGAGVRALIGHVARAWVQIFAIALPLFVGVENLEHLAIGLPAPGLAVLGSGAYHATLAIFAVTAFTAALVDALYRWRRDALVARIAAARARWARARAHATRRDLPWVERRHGSIAGHLIAGRAPPLAAR